MYLYSVDIEYVCFSIEVEKGKVVHAPGVAKWTMNKDWTEVEEYYKTKKNAKIKKIKL